jgi:hypothetical protein
MRWDPFKLRLASYFKDKFERLAFFSCSILSAKGRLTFLTIHLKIKTEISNSKRLKITFPFKILFDLKFCDSLQQIDSLSTGVLTREGDPMPEDSSLATEG